MRLIVAGTRTITARAEVERGITDALKAWGVTPGAVHAILSGGARGPDRFGEMWAAQRGIPSRVFQARWNVHGKAAGPMRNERMAENADALVAIWDGESPGTRDMIERAREHGLRVHVHLAAPTPMPPRYVKGL